MIPFNRHINRNVFAAVNDAVMAGLSFMLSVYIRLGSDQWAQAEGYLLPGTVAFTVVSALVFAYMRLYRGLWRYASMQDMITIVKAVTLSVLVFAVLMFTLTRLTGMPRSVLFINWMLLSFMLGGPRFFYRACKDRTLKLGRALLETPKIPVLLVGAGDAAELFIRDTSRDLRSSYRVVGIVDNNPLQRNRTMRGVRIMGDTGALGHVVRKLERKGVRPQKIIVTGDAADGSSLRELLEMADSLGIPLARLPKLSELKHGISERLEVRPIAVEDLLGRPQNVLDRDSMRALVGGKRVLVTGAGGTIGGELTRQIAAFQPSELILIEASEFNLYHIDKEIRGMFPDLSLTIVLCDVRDVQHVAQVFGEHRPQLVFHAAAIKHVPMAEINIEEAILTNVFGTRNIAEASQRYGAEAMVMISTDKAVNPGNVMGATKRLAESYCQALGHVEGKTKYITVRFGNVLGSTGSVVPLFSEQLRKGGPLTVTHQDITRYFMTVREAVELVMQAAVLGVGMHDRQECIFVLDMGQPVKIYDLAVQMIRLAGLRPEVDIKIVFTGLRPGEKLYEELFHDAESVVKTQHESISLASPRFTDMNSLRASLDTLFGHCVERRTQEALAMLKTLVPEFKSLFHP